MKVSMEYLENVIAKGIKSLCEESLYNDFVRALGCIKNHNEEGFSHPNYDKRPVDFVDDTFVDFIYNLTIVVLMNDTELDIGEDGTEIKTLYEVEGDHLYYSLSRLYSDCAYDDGFLTWNDEYGYLQIASGMDDGQLADEISEDTGYCVQTLCYAIKYG